MKATKYRKVSQKGFSNPVLIVVIILIVVGGLGFMYLSQNKGTISNQQTTTSKSSPESSGGMYSLNFKDANEFFPTNFRNFQINERGGYKVINLEQKEYKRPNDSRVAYLDKTLTADYVETPSSGKSVDQTTGFGLTYAKISNKDEVKTLSSLLDADLNAIARGFKKVDLPLQDIKYWAIYREVPDEKAKFAGDASIIFPDALVYLRLTVSSKYTFEQFQDIVKGYVDAILDKNIQYVEPKDIQ